LPGRDVARSWQIDLQTIAATLLVFVRKFLNPAVALPKLYVMTVNQVLGVLLGGVVVWADQLNRPEEMAVRTNK
jgi:hypothetical protein